MNQQMRPFPPPLQATKLPDMLPKTRFLPALVYRIVSFHNRSAILSPRRCSVFVVAYLRAVPPRSVPLDIANP